MVLEVFCVLLRCQIRPQAGDYGIGKTLEHTVPPQATPSCCPPAPGLQERIHVTAEQSRYLQVSASISTSHSPANKRGLITQCEWLVGTTTYCRQLLLLFCRQISGKPRRAAQPSPPAAAQGTAPQASRRHLVRTCGWVTLRARGGEITLCQPAASSARELRELSHPPDGGAGLVLDTSVAVIPGEEPVAVPCKRSDGTLIILSDSACRN